MLLEAMSIRSIEPRDDLIDVASWAEMRGQIRYAPSYSRRRLLQVAIAGAAGIALTRMTIGNRCVSGQEPASIARRDVSWLEQVQQSPQHLPDDAPLLSPLLLDGDAQAIATAAAWRHKHKRLVATWHQYLGSLGERKCTPPRITILERVRTAGVSRQLIRFEVEPGETTEAYLLRPTGGGNQRRAAVVVFHSTVDGSIRQPSGLTMNDSAEKAFALQLAQRGFVTLCPRNFLWPTNDKIDTQQTMRRFVRRHPGVTGMAKMLHDAQVALDLLAAQDDVDRDRLAAVGHSLGAKEALYLAAFDPRIRCTIASEGGIGMRFSNWDAPWYLGPEMHRGLVGHEHHELLAMVAPRAFLLVGGGTPNDGVGAKGADGDRSWPFVAEALKVYRLFDQRKAGALQSPSRPQCSTRGRGAYLRVAVGVCLRPMLARKPVSVVLLDLPAVDQYLSGRTCCVLDSRADSYGYWTVPAETAIIARR